LRFFNQKEQPLQDKIVTNLLVLFYLAWFSFMGLDFRFKWSSVPAWLQIPGLLGILLACYIAHLTFRENSFAAPVVKIQRERSQTVIMTGPYRYVRHPMYAGMLFYLFGAPLLFGSWWGMLWATVMVTLIAARIRVEERTLRKDLHGYDEYAVKVRYRLIPLVW
jgi:protein-S-isoprenylcysteine O-methyltransferase Ste14